MAARWERALAIGVLVVGAIGGCHESVTDGGGSAGGAVEAGSGARAGSAAGAGGRPAPVTAGASAGSAGSATARAGAGAGQGAAGQTANAGSGGRAGTGSAGNRAGASGSSSGAGGSGGSSDAGASGDSGTGGTAGANTEAGTGGAGGAVATPYSGWADACGGVTMNGRCVGETFEWCDYFARGVLRLDCAALGMRCKALDEQLGEWESNGCVGAPCSHSIVDCARCGPDGTCSVEGPGNPHCINYSSDCD